MDYKELVEKLKNLEAIAYGYNINGEVLGMDCSDFEQIVVDSADSITDLLSRAEVAEKERDWLRMCFDLAQRKEKEAENRAEKAEKCIADIKSAREHTRHAYVVDEILSKFYDGKEE